MSEIRSVPQLVKAYENIHRWRERQKDAIREGTERGLTTVTGVAGAAASGFVRGMGYQKIPGTDLDTDLVLGGVSVGAGILGLADKHSHALVSFGVAMAAPSIARIVESHVSAWRAR
jgi:hypothetical protein